MPELSEHQLHVLGKMRFDRYYRSNELGVKLSVNRDFMLDLEKDGLVHRKTKGVFGTQEGDPNFEVWYKKRVI